MTDHMRSNAILGLLIVTAASVGVSLTNVLAPIVYEFGSNPATLMFFRFALFVAVCLPWLKWRRIRLALAPQHRVSAIVAGIIYTVGSTSLISAFAHMPVSLVILIFYTYPLITRLAECAIDRHRPAAFEIACLLAALAGLALCLGVAPDRINAIGLAFSLSAAVGVAGSFVWAGRKLAAVPPTLQTFYMGSTGLVLAIVVTSAAGAWAFPPADALSWSPLLAAALCSAAAFLAMFIGVRMIGASQTAMVMNTEPVLTIGLAILLLGETLSVNQVAGATIVIAAIFFAQVRKSDKP